VYVFPFERPVVVDWCDVEPLPLMVVVREEYSVFGDAEYLHVAGSFVETESVIKVVPAAYEDTVELLITGAVISVVVTGSEHDAVVPPLEP
jgi:hypothetical protein